MLPTRPDSALDAHEARRLLRFLRVIRLFSTPIRVFVRLIIFLALLYYKTP